MSRYSSTANPHRDDLFSSRASLDSLFEPASNGTVDAADILVIGYEDGTVHLSIYDLFEIGTFCIGRDASRVQPRPLLHSSHPFSTTHCLLASLDRDLCLVPFDLRLIHDAGRHLSSVASKSTQIRHILRYLRQAQQQIRGEFKASQILPQRFIALIDEDLKKNHDCNWEQAAYHLVATGNCLPAMKEWLVDQLSERVRMVPTPFLEAEIYFLARATEDGKRRSLRATKTSDG